MSAPQTRATMHARLCAHAYCLGHPHAHTSTHRQHTHTHTHTHARTHARTRTRTRTRTHEKARRTHENTHSLPPPPRPNIPRAPQIREAYLDLGHRPADDRLRVLLAAAAGRGATIARKTAARAATRLRVALKQRSKLFAKIKRARRRRLRELRFGQGWRATRRQAADAAAGRPVAPTWWQRRLRPPGRMRRRF
jgi:hypothetical protein